MGVLNKTKILAIPLLALGCNAENSSLSSLTTSPGHDPLLGGHSVTVTPQLYWAFEGEKSEAVKPGELTKGRSVHVVDSKWIGLPPLGNSYDSRIEIGEGDPAWWTELDSLGLRANGIVAAFSYSEGWEAYFYQYIRPNIHTELYRALLGQELSEIRNDLDAQLREKDTDILLDLNTIAPMITHFEATISGSHSANWIEYCRRERNITDYQTCADLYQYYAMQIYAKIFREYRLLLPLAGVSLYGMPVSEPMMTWSTPEIANEIQLHNRQTLFWLWPLVDYLAPTFVQPYRLKSRATRLNPGEQGYKEFIEARKGYATEVAALSEIIQKPVIAVLMPILDKPAQSFSGQPLQKLEWSALIELVKSAKANALMFRPTRGFEEGFEDSMNRGFVNGNDYLKSFLSGAGTRISGQAQPLQM